MIAKLFRLEFRKLIPSSTFWILLILHGIVLVLVSTNLSSFLKNANLAVNDIPDIDLSLSPILQFPDVWQNLTYIAGYFKIILAIIIIISISNEFSSGTARQNIIDGMSRRQWLFSKIGLAKVLAIYSTIIVIILCLVIGISQNSGNESAQIFNRLEFVLAYFFELVTYFIYAIFLALVIRKTGLAIILLLVYDLIIEPILSWSLPEKLRTFLPMSVIDNLNKFPFLKYVDPQSQQNLDLEQLIWTVAYAALFGFFSLLILEKKDL